MKNIRKVLTSVLLVVLLGFLAKIVYTRGFGARLGAKAAPLAAPFTTEEAWVVDEIVRDITEMSAYPRSAPPVQVTDVQRGSGVFRVAVGGFAPIDVDLHDDLWSPAAFAALARQRLADGGNSAAGPAQSSAFGSLVELTPATLVASDAAISKTLASDMHNVPAHEAAALTLAGFALREAEGRLNDTRWAMNRMTAHLAIAIALRGSRAPGVDARLAEATLLALSDRQTRALAILDGLNAAKPDAAVTAWTRALRMRITDDWRQLSDPAHATRLEQREYFRARRATTIRVSKGTAELEKLGIPLEAEWVRIIHSNGVGVEDASLVTEALDLERAEYEDVFARIHGHAIDEHPAKALNTPASRCVSANAVHVLPWGAWAEFAQRHMSMTIGRYDSYLRHSVGAGDQADTQQLALKRDFGELWIFPMSTIFWTKGPNGKEADLRYINEAVDAVLSAPHRVPAVAWQFLDFGTKYEPVRRGIPPAATWFMSAAPRSAYEAGVRVKSGFLRNPADMAALLDGAPYDVQLINQYLTMKYGQKAPFEEITRLAGDRMSYDVRPGSWALAILPENDSRRVAILDASCHIAAGSCADLGWELAKTGHDDDAAKAYEQAFADPALDAVAVANKSRWLAQYYASHNRVGPALQLATRVAGTGASEGLTVAAHLYERLGRTADAEAMYQDVMRSYDEPAELLGFYYREVEVKKGSQYADAWKAARERVFPNGLTNAPLTADKPAVGVHISSDSDAARKIGLRAGDIVVALDGWHVENLPQYYAVRAFADAGPITLTVWRGQLADVRIADRMFRPLFQVENYPVQGWIER